MKRPVVTSAVSWGLVLRRVAIVVLLALIVIRPAFGTTEVATKQTDLAVLLVVDRTTSMDALDVDGGPRFDRVRADLEALVDFLPEARFAVVSFASSARLELPFTSDAAIVKRAIEGLDLEDPVEAQGSRLDAPLERVLSVLQAAQAAAPDRRTVLVLASDGENTAPAVQASYQPVFDYVDDGAVLGYGTAAGGRMTVDPGGDVTAGYLQDRSTGRDAVSRLDAANLAAVADQLGVPYVHRDRVDGIEAVAARIDAGGTVAGTEVAADRELTWLFAGLLLGLAVLELRRAWLALAATAWERRAVR